jgi:hypothetical protein
MTITRPSVSGMPIILATQEAAIRRIEVKSQPQANSSQDPISKKSNTKKGWWSGSKYRLQVQAPVVPQKQINKQKMIVTTINTNNIITTVK